MNLPVYLDNHATTAVDARVLAEMLPYFTQYFGNAASAEHPHGWKAREAVEHARAQVAGLVDGESSEVIFTSGATESINCVLKGIAHRKSRDEIRVVTCVTEHSAVLDTCTFLESKGAQVTRLPVRADGTLDLELLKATLAKGADLVTLMHANNEIGTVHPIEQIGTICKNTGALFHVDAAQSFGKLPINFGGGLIDFLSVSGHKIYAPKGVGCLLIKRRIPPLRLSPMLHGGGHERGFRSGTLNVPGIVALGKAAEISASEMEEEAVRTAELRNLLLQLLKETVDDIIINGTMAHRLPVNLNISIPGIEAQLLLPELRGKISVSSGSACTSSSPKPSYVLAAIGVPDGLAQASIRFGIGRTTSETEIRYAASTVADSVKKLRHSSANI